MFLPERMGELYKHVPELLTRLHWQLARDSRCLLQLHVQEKKRWKVHGLLHSPVNTPRTLVSKRVFLPLAVQY